MNCLICRDLLRAFGAMFDEVPRCSFFCVLDPTTFAAQKNADIETRAS